MEGAQGSRETFDLNLCMEEVERDLTKELEARSREMASNLNLLRVDAVVENGGGGHKSSGSHEAGSSRTGAGNNPSGVQSVSLEIENQPSVRAAGPVVNETCEKFSILHMPRVSTRWPGVNGEKVEGFLYEYKKADEVRIVCLCHGRFFSPAEFIIHGGGGDVKEPFKHILVTYEGWRGSV